MAEIRVNLLLRISSLCCCSLCHASIVGNPICPVSNQFSHHRSARLIRMHHFQPQQQCFNKWDAPCYPPGHSVWPHQNNLVCCIPYTLFHIYLFSHHHTARLTRMYHSSHRGNTSTSQTDHVSLGMHLCPLYSWVVTTTNLCGAATTIKTAVDF